MNNVRMRRVLKCSPSKDNCGFTSPLHDASLLSYIYMLNFSFRINKYKVLAQAMGYYWGPCMLAMLIIIIKSYICRMYLHLSLKQLIITTHERKGDEVTIVLYNTCLKQSISTPPPAFYYWIEEMTCHAF